MKTDKYSSKQNGTTVFVKDYSASIRMQVEMSNASSFFSALPVALRITPNHSPINRLLWIPVRGNNYSPGYVTRNWSSRNQ